MIRPFPDLVFIFGLGSRYSYLAMSRLPMLEQRAEQRFTLWPVSSPRLIRNAHGGHSPFESASLAGQYDPSYRATDAARWAAHYELPYLDPIAQDLQEDDLALACWAVDDEEKRAELCKVLFDVLFVQRRCLDRAKLARLVRATGADLEDDWLTSPGVAAKHDAVIEKSLNRGVFGVPTFLIRDEAFWGNDRIPLVEDAIDSLTELKP